MNRIPVNLQDLRSLELLGLYSSILTELNRRRVVRSRNAPAGDYAELLVAEHVRGTLAANAAKSFDVTDPSGRTIQVKCLVKPAGTQSGGFSPFRSFDFDSCIFVLLDSVSYEVTRAAEIPPSVVEAMARDVAWVAGKRVSITQAFAVEGARDITEVLRATQERVDRDGTDGRGVT